MKNLYGYSDEVELRAEEITGRQINSEEELQQILDKIGAGDISMVTLGDYFLKFFSYSLGIPSEVWYKRLVDFTEEDAEILNSLSENVITFTRT